MDRRAAKTKSLATTVAVLVALAISACGDGGDSNTVAAQCGAVEYPGQGKPDAVIASDLPMRGDSRERSRQMVEAIRIVLERDRWRAGPVTVGLRVCDDTSSETGLWSAGQCRANAHSYVDDPSLTGVVGTYNSGCAEEIIPILNDAQGGSVAMVSPGNTLICLTEPADTCTGGEPGSLYPSHGRSYARVIPNDAFQGAALAELAARKADSAYVLYAADDPTSLGQATTFRNAARQLGLDVAGFKAWDPNASDYRDLMGQVGRTDAGAVVLAGLTEQNAGRLVQDKVGVLGPNAGRVALLGFDGLTQQATIDAAKGAADGMLATIPGRAPPNLTGKGKQIVTELRQRIGSQPVELFAPYAAEAAEVLLSAIAKADGQRGDVAAAILPSQRHDGILGSYGITANGDPTVGPVSVFVARRSFEPENEIIPGPQLVAAARGQ